MSTPLPERLRSRAEIQGREFAKLLTEAADEIERLRCTEAMLVEFLKAYVHESPRPDCLPEMRWRATMPNGTMTWHPTVEGACEAINGAVKRHAGLT